jgi:hypothetical protein
LKRANRPVSNGKSNPHNCDTRRSVTNEIVNIQDRYRRFLDSLEAARPGSRRLAATQLVKHEGSDSIFFPSPANRRKLSFWIWIDDENEWSITFGDWHTHACVASASDCSSDDSIVSIARGILDSRFVIAIDGDGEHAGFSTVIWIDDPKAVIEMFAHSWSPITIHLRSWDGTIAAAITASSPPIIAP